MSAWWAIAAAVAAAPCAGLDGTFVQLSERELGRDEAAWADDVAWLRRLGLGTLVVQYTGDTYGAFDGRAGGAAPVASLLSAAEQAGLEVWLGLHHDPSWPHAVLLQELPPPLGHPAGAEALAGLCRRHAACAGFYVSPEVDETTFAAFAPEVGAWLGRVVARLDALAPGKRVALAPFASRTAPPDATAAFWRRVLPGSGVDVIMLQDGVGTGQADVSGAARRLATLRAALADDAVEVWAVVELFRQLHGPPVDDRPFRAMPADPDRVSAAIAAQAPHADRLVAFAALDHLAPKGGAPGRRLEAAYGARCAPDGRSTSALIVPLSPRTRKR